MKIILGFEIHPAVSFEIHQDVPSTIPTGVPMSVQNFLWKFLRDISRNSFRNYLWYSSRSFFRGPLPPGFLYGIPSKVFLGFYKSSIWDSSKSSGNSSGTHSKMLPKFFLKNFLLKLRFWILQRSKIPPGVAFVNPPRVSSANHLGVSFRRFFREFHIETSRSCFWNSGIRIMGIFQ